MAITRRTTLGWLTAGAASAPLLSACATGQSFNNRGHCPCPHHCSESHCTEAKDGHCACTDADMKGHICPHHAPKAASDKA